MKLKVLFLVLCLGLLSGCKSLSKSELINQKRDLNKVNKNDTGSIREVVKAPDTEKFELVSKDSSIKIKVNAEVVVPITDAISVAKVRNRNLSNLDLEAISKYFFKGEEYRYARELSELSKPELAVMIEEQKRIMKNEAAYEGYTIEEKEENEKMNQDYLYDLEANYEKAPDTTEQTPIEYKLKDENNNILGEKTKSFLIESVKKGSAKNLTVSCGKYRNTIAYFAEGEMGTFSGYFDGYTNKCKYSEDEVKRQCDDIIKILGVKGEYKLERCVPTIGYDQERVAAQNFYNGYEVIYKKIINDVIETYDTTSIVSKEEQSEDEASYSPKQYESMEFLFGIDGLCYFAWNEPMKVDKIIKKNADLITYAEAIEVFKKKMLSAKEDIECNISEIKLGLMRVKCKGKREEYIMIPVWDFFGDSSIESGEGEFSCLTINAMDGSIIDRSLGY
ncbi:DUF6034 family protein [Anaerosacchariphilus polymeriproducens]|uniref:Uncharacterized protein n=1 Tax=Anaerosacchariphilus polymeriproducens TaxID=1812858 RepID=A0A371AV81_9FIRM|nr:DUF6034 family protein [Anaerosacchariphilus polymeriproducens]RDU23485.1 hypothetical protein DWV06_09305 [Anaerosacchariphilus polymeriproducens]